MRRAPHPPSPPSPVPKQGRLPFQTARWGLRPWPLPAAPAGRLVLHALRAFDVPNADKKHGGCSDPFLRAALLEGREGKEAEAQTGVRTDEPSPVWGDVLVLPLARGSVWPPLLRLRAEALAATAKAEAAQGAGCCGDATH